MSTNECEWCEPVIIKPSHAIIGDIDADKILSKIEGAGRVCYQSQGKNGAGNSKTFVKMLIQKGHESVLEHENISVSFVTDRGISHELVRHRIASYSQESTRYCAYRDKLQFIVPSELKPGTVELVMWYECCSDASHMYHAMLKKGIKPETARSILPHSLATNIVMTANLREWRHFFKLRTSKFAHSDMRALVVPLLEELKQKLPVVFDDIEAYYGSE